MTNSVFIFISESLLLTFSGLRIRLKQNADNGADHGTVCNVFIIGKITKIWILMEILNTVHISEVFMPLL